MKKNIPNNSPVKTAKKPKESQSLNCKKLGLKVFGGGEGNSKFTKFYKDDERYKPRFLVHTFSPMTDELDKMDFTHIIVNYFKGKKGVEDFFSFCLDKINEYNTYIKENPPEQITLPKFIALKEKINIFNNSILKQIEQFEQENKIHCFLDIKPYPKRLEINFTVDVDLIM